MKQTNYQLFDFMDFDPAMSGKETLWKACAPVSLEVDGTDVVFEIPFQKQKVSNDIEPDKEAPRKIYSLRIRAYGSKVVRLAIGFETAAMPDSVMLDMHPELQLNPLHVEKTD